MFAGCCCCCCHSLPTTALCLSVPLCLVFHCPVSMHCLSQPHSAADNVHIQCWQELNLVVYGVVDFGDRCNFCVWLLASDSFWEGQVLLIQSGFMNIPTGHWICFSSKYRAHSDGLKRRIVNWFACVCMWLQNVRGKFAVLCRHDF